MNPNDETSPENAPESTPEESSPKKKVKRWQVVLGIVAAVIVCAGAGFWTWHEQPSFCGAICHVPMDSYLETYNEPANSTGTDKWGNEVSNTDAMLAVVHREEGETCLSCHVPTLSEQIGEGIGWITGDYVYPLYETDLEQLTEASGMEEDSFCLRSGCHTSESGDAIDDREALVEATSDLEFNPHTPQHGERACSDCHKAHRASVLVCASCHTEAELPDGWITPEEESELMVQ